MSRPVAILDAGGQYVDLVRKAVERQGVPAKVLALNTELSELKDNYQAVIISGSPASSHAESAPKTDPKLWQSDLPILGICYGMQSMVVSCGGEVAKNAIREDGRITTQINSTHPIFKGLKDQITALFTHGDFVKKLPDGFKVIGSHKMSDGQTAYSAVVFGNKYGVQFHPEVFDDSPDGYQIFKNFLELADVKTDSEFSSKQLDNIVNSKQKQIIEQVNGRDVIAFVSGGVDSSVAALLASKVIPKEKFHAFYIDSGFMRYEDDLVIDELTDAGLKVKKINAVKDFEDGIIELNGQKFGPLISVHDPEIKRKIIGKVFIDIQNRIIKELNLKEALLLQGTNAADRIESGHNTGDSHTMTIKTHHNQVNEVQELKRQGLLLEPIDDLFKDEVRELGEHLGLPYDLVQRQPFPGPGLAIRIIASGQINNKQPDPDLEQRLKEFVEQVAPGAKSKILPVKSVGVGGDERSHLKIAAIQNSELTSEQLATFANDIPAHFRGEINRVVYALLDNPISKIKITNTNLDKTVRDQLKEADKIVFEEMRANQLLEKIKQFPVIILPIGFGENDKRSIVLRPVSTSTFMTVQAMLPGRDLKKTFFDSVSKRIIKEVNGISQVFLDLTNKPPATTEWE